MPEDRFTKAEQQRQASQAGAEQARARTEADHADERAEQAQQAAELDPNSPEGRQAAIRRGDPVQLRGEEESRGMVKGTSTTTNESGAGFPASDEHRFVTGAAGVPIPESQADGPQRPGDFSPDADERDMSPQDVDAPPQDAGMDPEAGRADEPAVATETPETRAAREANKDPERQRAEQERGEAEEARQAEQDAAGKGARPRKSGKDEDTGDHGPGTTQ